MKKYLFLFIAFIAFLQINFGQTVTTEKVDGYFKAINLDADYPNIVINSWDNDYVEVTAKVLINGGEDDENFDLDIDLENQTLYISGTTHTEGIDQKMVVYDKDGKRLVLNNKNTWKQFDDKGYSNVNIGFDMEIILEISMPNNKKVFAEATYGDIQINGNYNEVNAHSTYGIVEAVLPNTNNMHAISLVSSYDLVDLSIDRNSHANFSLNASDGSMYTNLPLEQTNSIVEKKKSSSSCNSPCGAQASTRYTLNNGSMPIKISATYGSIYIRDHKKGIKSL